MIISNLKKIRRGLDWKKKALWLEGLKSLTERSLDTNPIVHCLRVTEATITCLTFRFNISHRIASCRQETPQTAQVGPHTVVLDHPSRRTSQWSGNQASFAKTRAISLSSASV